MQDGCAGKLKETILESTRRCLYQLRCSAEGVFLSSSVILISAVFSINLHNILHRFPYNHIKQHYTHSTNPTMCLWYCLQRCCELQTAMKRKEKRSVRRPLQGNTLCS